MSNRLSGKVVIVTGAAQGIGFGCASLIASEGAAVVLGDVQEEKGKQAADANPKYRWQSGILQSGREE